MSDGTVTQFGTTAEIYRKPDSLTAARVFSDPPINAARIRRPGRRRSLRPGCHGRSAARRRLPDGDYTMAIRPHHVSPLSGGAD